MIPKKNIDAYITNNPLNSRLYEVLLCLNDRKTCAKNKLKKTPLQIFNQAYAVCAKLQQESHPEEAAMQIWEQLRQQFLLCETNIIFSCVYIILFFAKNENPNMKYFLHRIRNKIDNGYFQDFEPLITEELTYLTTLPADFEWLKNKADQIQDLAQKELFYADYLTHYKQAHSKGNIEQQISDEINLIHTTKTLAGTDREPLQEDIASIKVRSVVIVELLKQLKLGPAHNDLTKISKLIAFITGNNYTSIYTKLQKGINFTTYHAPHITQANQILTALNAQFTIDPQKQY